MEIIRFLLRNSGENFFLAAFASLLSGFSSAGFIAVINYAIASLPDLPGWLLWAFIGLGFSLGFFQFVSRVLIARLSQQLIYQLRLDLTQKILHCPLQQTEMVGTPKLLAALTGDINTIAFASIQLATILVNSAILVGVFVYLAWLSPLLFAIVFGSMLGGYIIYAVIQQQGIKSFAEGRQVQDILFKQFGAVTEGIKELKLHRPRRLAFINEELKPTANDARFYWVKAISSFALAGSVGTALFFVPIGLMLFVFPQRETISTTVISSYALAILYAMSPITQIVTALPQLAQANVSLAKVDSLGLSLTQSVTEPNFPTGSSLDTDWQNLDLIDISHSYGGESEEHQFTLSQINLEFKPGEIVFIVGGNGSGKSTLIKLITGLYNPDHGKILFNKLPVSDTNREWYRQQFAAIFYDFYLFDRLIGIDSSQQEITTKYLKLLEIDHKVTIKDGILSTTNLSQGQRKRLALLTAYLEDRPIYVFDEWASDQDPIFKKVFYKELLPELKSRGKTVIAVTHDDRYFNYCDRLIKLDFGRLVKTN